MKYLLIVCAACLCLVSCQKKGPLGLMVDDKFMIRQGMGLVNNKIDYGYTYFFTVTEVGDDYVKGNWSDQSTYKDSEGEFQQSDIKSVRVLSSTQLHEMASEYHMQSIADETKKRFPDGL